MSVVLGLRNSGLCLSVIGSGLPPGWALRFPRWLLEIWGQQVLAVGSEYPPRVHEHEDGKEIIGSMGRALTGYVTEAWQIISLSFPTSQPSLSQQSSGLIYWDCEHCLSWSMSFWDQESKNAKHYHWVGYITWATSLNAKAKCFLTFSFWLK